MNERDDAGDTTPLGLLGRMYPWPWALAREEPTPSWPERLRDQIESHLTAEGEVLAEYRSLAEECDAEDIRYLAGILLEDERRHHRWFQQLKATIQSEIDLRKRGDTVPHLGHDPVDPGLLEVTERMLEMEEEDARGLAELRETLDPVAETTLWGLLVDIMERDTQKHIHVLKFIRHTLRQRDRSSA